MPVVSVAASRSTTAEAAATPEPPASVPLSAAIATEPSVSQPSATVIEPPDGATVSSTHACEAGVGSGFADASTARTSNVRAPSGSAPVVSGDAHGLQAPPSKRHWKVEPDSVELKTKVGVASLSGSAGAESIVVSGLTLSTRRSSTTAEAVAFPAASVAIARRS